MRDSVMFPAQATTTGVPTTEDLDLIQLLGARGSPALKA